MRVQHTVLDTQDTVIKYQQPLHLVLSIWVIVTQNECHLGHLNE